jgi:hypothetical protein
MHNSIFLTSVLATMVLALLPGCAATTATPANRESPPDIQSALLLILEHNDLSDSAFAAHALAIKFHGVHRGEWSKVLPDKVPESALASDFSYTATWGGYDRKRTKICLAMTLRECPYVRQWPFHVRQLQASEAAGVLWSIAPRGEGGISFEMFQSNLNGLCSIDMHQYVEGEVSLSLLPIATSGNNTTLAREIGELASIGNLRNVKHVSEILKTEFFTGAATLTEEGHLKQGSLYTLQPPPLIDGEQFRYDVWNAARTVGMLAHPKSAGHLVTLSFKVDLAQACAHTDDIPGALSAAGVRADLDINNSNVFVAKISGLRPTTLTVTSQDSCITTVSLQQETTD